MSTHRTLVRYADEALKTYKLVPAARRCRAGLRSLPVDAIAEAVAAGWTLRRVAHGYVASFRAGTRTGYVMPTDTDLTPLLARHCRRQLALYRPDRRTLYRVYQRYATFARMARSFQAERRAFMDELVEMERELRLHPRKARSLERQYGPLSVEE